MSGFKFGLQKVLDLRVWREQETATRLGEARQREEEARRALEMLEELRKERYERLAVAHGHGGSVGQLQNLSFVLQQLDARIADAAARHAEAENDVEQSRTVHAEASRDRKVLEKLRSRQQEASLLESRRAEQRDLDEIALTRHARANGVAGGGGES